MGERVGSGDEERGTYEDEAVSAMMEFPFDGEGYGERNPGWTRGWWKLGRNVR